MCADCCIAQCIVLIGSALFTLTVPPLPSLCPRSPSRCPVHPHCAPFTINGSFTLAIVLFTPAMPPVPSRSPLHPHYARLTPQMPSSPPPLSSLCLLHLTLPHSALRAQHTAHIPQQAPHARHQALAHSTQQHHAGLCAKHHGTGGTERVKETERV